MTKTNNVCFIELFSTALLTHNVPEKKNFLKNWTLRFNNISKS